MPGTQELTANAEAILTNEAVAHAGVLIAILGFAGFILAPVVGLLADKFDRLACVAVALSLNFCTYGSMILINDDDDPTGQTDKTIFVIIFAIGISEAAGVFSTSLYVQQEAPPDARGAVLGLFGLCGNLGIMINSGVGGFVFEAWRRTGPFIYLGCINAVVAVVCFATYLHIAPKLRP